jgi:hypothetical protein
MNEFEQKLSRQPLRQVPAEWRKEILAAARPDLRHAPRTSFLSTINSQLSTLFWPHPKVWAGLAAIWVFIFLLNFSMRDKAPMVAERTAPPSPEVIAELKQQQRMFAELIGSTEARVADRQKMYSPKPHSESAEILDA